MTLINIKLNTNNYMITKKAEDLFTYSYSIELEDLGKIYLYKKFKSIEEAEKYAKILNDLYQGLKQFKDFYLKKDFKTGEFYLQLRAQFKESEQLQLFPN